MKRVLIVAFDFPPQGGSGTVRVTKFAKYLPEFGWQPVVVCSDTLWNPDESLARDVPPDTPVYRVKSPRWVQSLRPPPPAPGKPKASPSSPQRKSPLKSKLASLAREWVLPDTNVFWVPAAVRQCRKLLEKGNIAAIFTTSPPNSVQLVGYFLKRRFPEIPWIADFRDLWSQGHVLENRKVLYQLNYFLEKNCLKTATRSLVVTEGIRRLTLEKFPRDILPGANLITLTNGYDPSDMMSLSPAQPNDKLTLTFTGSLYEARSRTEFIPALEELSADEALRDQVRVRFIGFFPPGIQQQLQKLCEMGVASIHPPVPRQEALAEMAQANALLLLEADIFELRLNHSNKLFEYLATGKPIFAVIPHGEASRLIQEEKAGIVVHPNDREGIKQVVLKLLEDFKRASGTLPPDPDKYVRYQRRTLSHALADILDRCANKANEK